MTKAKVHQYTQKYGKLNVSPQVLDRLRVMYLFDLGTSWGDGGGRIADLVISGDLNPEWAKSKDVFKHPELSEWQVKDLQKEGDKVDWGCFGIRRTKKSFLVSANIARIPVAKVQLRKRVVKFTRNGKVWKVVKDGEIPT